MKVTRFIIWSLFLVSLLAACGSTPEQDATQTAASWTATPLPTSTPAPTSTPEPTSTPKPSVRDDSGNVIIPAGGKIRIAVLDPTDLFQDMIFTGVLLAVEDYGSITGFEIDLIEIDDYCVDSNLDHGAETAASDPTIVGVVGPICSGATRDSLPVLEEARIITVSPAASMPGLFDFGPSIFNRVIFDENQKATAGIHEDDFMELSSVQEFLQRIIDRFNAPADQIEDGGIFFALSYDAATVLLAAIEESATLSPDGTLVVDWQALAQAVRNTADLEGLTGNITIDDQGNRVP